VNMENIFADKKVGDSIYTQGGEFDILSITSDAVNAFSCDDPPELIQFDLDGCQHDRRSIGPVAYANAEDVPRKREKRKYPLYPELSEEGKKEAQGWLDKFREKMKKVCDETLSEVYCNVLDYIESDSWSNFRNEIMDGFRNYNNGKIQAEYDFKEIRQQILKHHRADIITDLNQDLVEETERLKKQVEEMRESMRKMY
jgi:hypothetical protein